MFDKLLATQWNLHFNGIRADKVSAYHKHFSSQTELVCLVEDWKDCLDEDLMLAVSIDLLKASDNLSPNLLLAKLEAYDLYKQAWSLLRDYLYGR